MTVSESLKDIIEQFTKASIETPILDAEIILSHILDIERYRLITDNERELTLRENKLLEQHSKRRISGEPVAYIVGKKEFYSPKRLSLTRLNYFI